MELMLKLVKIKNKFLNTLVKKLKIKKQKTKGGKEITGGETDFSGRTETGGKTLGSNQKVVNKGGKKYYGRATDDPERMGQTTKRPAGSIQSRITGDLDRSDIVTDVDKSAKGQPSSSRSGKAVQLAPNIQTQRRNKEREDKALDSKKGDLAKREKFLNQRISKGIGKIPKDKINQEKKSIAKEKGKLRDLERRGTLVNIFTKDSRHNRERNN